MKNLASSLQLGVLFALVVSCGASAAEIKTARETRYKAAPATLYAEVKAVTEGEYKTAVSDEGALVLQTQARWYTPDGQIDTTRGDNPSRLQDNSINLSLVVGLVKVDADSYKVQIEPIVLRQHGLTSKPDRLDAKDPLVPGWVHGKLESLQVSIFERLKPYAVAGATVPAMVPPAAAPPAALPAATGSAATEPAPPPAP